MVALADKPTKWAMEIVDYLIFGPFVILLLGVLCMQIWDTYEVSCVAPLLCSRS